MTGKPASTRGRIVEAARGLFNEQGYGAVTTAALAEHCAISEGNLWYHFKTKRALLDALGAQFAASIEARLALVPNGDPVTAYARLLAAMMDEFRTFRFLYRDHSGYGEHPAVIEQNAPRWLNQTFAQLARHLLALVEARLLDWPRERLDDLAINATIILRYGLEHLRELGEPTGTGSGVVQRTLERHLTLFEHKLAPAASDQLRRAIAQIENPALAA